MDIKKKNRFPAAVWCLRNELKRKTPARDRIA